ncbi:bifunctional diguanylate cyclase/phosphodiesterase [Acidovorax sp. A1169]|uniref:sensor domain-containing protein n=1 Tax=Acidovorax sp. A1169 TaxID=3059524 RepID=UPI002737DB7D|nr:bifunctional diguanylate cyclase/phosphodiesterase [Acidovorax sp. A1169]MDP4078014.1 EAL domain-containing protein [Acidovorax sp. A1169]
MIRPLPQAWIDGLLEAVWLVDEKTLYILAANQAAEHLTGLSIADMLGTPVTLLAATPQDQIFWSQPAAVVADGIHSHTSVLHATGILVAVERRVTRVPRLEGGTAFLVTMVDRSHQQATERELETLLAELRATLDSAADGMLVCGLDGRVRAFNQRLAQLWNVPAPLLVRRDDEALFAHMADQVADVPTYVERLAAVVAEPMQESIDILGLRNGMSLERRSVPQFSQGRAVGRVYSFRDITRQNEVQASLRLAARVFESSMDAIFIADSHHRLMRMNPGCERLVGKTARAFEGAGAASLFGGGPDADFMAQVEAGWAREGFWEGELWLPRENDAYCAVQLSWVALRDDEDRLVQSIGFMRDLTLQHAAQKRIEELAYSDVLTGLPNRLLLSQRVDTAIQGARQSDTGFAILFLDLDRFKIINDSLGHPFGDRVLQLVAERLQTCLRQTDMLCRLGGDEFVIYLHGGDAVVAESVARRILDEMLRPFTLDSMGFSIQCSIGMALYPQDGSSLDELIKQADTAMYQVKERGRGSYGFYQPQMNANLLSRMKLEHAMRQALGEQRMAVHYQPQVSMETGAITGAEALIRWTDPEFGSVSPGMFIPLAEESGYIVTLGAWVMEQAVREAAAWIHSGHPIVVSVNVSALEFRQPDFVERLTRLLAVHQLPPTLLELELTETILLQDAAEMEQRLHELAGLGVSLAIDDFGTGYSSLAYLKKLPIHKLKIDQSFVRGLPDDDGDRAIVSAIISMGRAMRIEVVAEGVETEVQRAVLQQMHCDHYQGFLCAPGLPAEDFRRLLGRPTVAPPGVPAPQPVAVKPAPEPEGG